MKSHNSIRCLFALLLCCALALTFLIPAGAEGFSFPLPKEMHIPDNMNISEDYPIVCSGQRIGGLIYTDLEPLVLVMNDPEPVLRFVEQYVPQGLVYDYMMGWGNERIDLSLIIVDPNTMQTREIQHNLFAHGETVCDLWIDTRYADADMQHALLIAAGLLAPEDAITPPVPEYRFDFSLPEGFTLGEAEEDSCPILFGGVKVGGFVGTTITPEQLTEDDHQLNLADYLTEEEEQYAEDSRAEFTVIRQLSHGLPDTSGYEYILMYGEDSQGMPMASVSWKVTDKETGDVGEYSHTLFCKDGIVYDLWLDKNLLDSDRNYGFLSAAGIN